MAPEPTTPTTPTTPAPFIPGFASPLASAAQLTERLLDARIVVVGGQIDDALANTVCSQLLVLDAVPPGGISGPPGTSCPRRPAPGQAPSGAGAWLSQPPASVGSHGDLRL